MVQNMLEIFYRKALYCQTRYCMIKTTTNRVGICALSVSGRGVVAERKAKACGANIASRCYIWRESASSHVARQI